MSNVELGGRAQRLVEPSINSQRGNTNDTSSTVSYDRVSDPDQHFYRLSDTFVLIQTSETQR